MINYLHNLIDIQQDTNGVTLKFENPNQKPVQVDMIIGADGIHSTVVPVYSNVLMNNHRLIRQ